MRVLFMSTPAASHLTVMVPLAWALRAAGHEVIVAGQPDVTGAAAAAGLPVAVIGEPFDAIEAVAAGLPPGKRPNEVGRSQAGGPDQMTLIQPWLMHARYLTAAYLDFARAWRPDLVISDPHEFSALGVGGILGVPVVHHRWDVSAGADQARAAAAKVLGARFARMGLRGGLPEPALVLDPCPPSVQVPDGPTAYAMRYVPYNGTGDLPPWASETPTRPRVAVTFGALTAELNGIPLFQAVLTALDRLDGVEAVVTLPARYRAELGPVGGRIRVVDPVPLTFFLDSCAAVVHHGGTGTSLTASALGLPQLVLPQLGNEPVWARRLAETGAALAVVDPVEQNDPDLLGERLGRLVSEPAFAADAALLAKEIASLPTPAQTVAVLERLVDGGGAAAAA